MYLYSLINERQDEDDNYFVGEVTLLQHEKDYTEDEFINITDKYKGYSNWYIADQLKEHHGFRIVPKRMT